MRYTDRNSGVEGGIAATGTAFNPIESQELSLTEEWKEYAQKNSKANFEQQLQQKDRQIEELMAQVSSLQD
jgi:hypothetical protein